jgi:hypothetical protein
MKTKKLVYVGILILFVAPILLAEDYKKEISVEEAMKAFCGTWFSDGSGTKKDIYNLNGTYELYYLKKATVPMYTGPFKIEKAWIDEEGNVWLTVWRSFQGSNSWALTKISNDGTVLDYCRYYAADNAPNKIDPDDGRCQFKYIKKKIE